MTRSEEIKNLKSMLSGKSIETVAAPALTSPQPLSKGEGLEPALVKVSKRFNNFYRDNSDFK
jgi:hypothetical protein